MNGWNHAGVILSAVALLLSVNAWVWGYMTSYSKHINSDASHISSKHINSESSYSTCESTSDDLLDSSTSCGNQSSDISEQLVVSLFLCCMCYCMHVSVSSVCNFCNENLSSRKVHNSQALIQILTSIMGKLKKHNRSVFWEFLKRKKRSILDSGLLTT